MRDVYGGMIRAGFVVVVFALALASTASAALGPGGRPCQDRYFVGDTVPRAAANLAEGLKRGINGDVFAMRVYIGRAASISHTGPVPCKPALVRQWRVMGASLKGYQRGVDQIISKEPQGAATIRAATRKFTAVTVAVGNPVGPVLIRLAAKL